jgi:hypothetical protein
LPALTSGSSTSTASASSDTGTATISSTMQYDSKHLGSHGVLSELSTSAPRFAPVFSLSTSPEMFRALSPTLASVDRPQQHQQAQQAQQLQDCTASAATTPGQIFFYHPPTVLRASIKNNDSSYHFDDLAGLGRSSRRKGP